MLKRNHLEDDLRFALMVLENKRREILEQLGVLEPTVIEELAVILKSFEEIESRIDAKLGLMDERLSTIEKLIEKEVNKHV